MSGEFATGKGADGQFADREKALTAAKQNGKTERGVVTCPRCGEAFQNLPSHLPACDGGEA